MQRTSLRQPTSYTFGYYVTLDAIEREQAQGLLAAAGATLPIQWGQHRTLVKFHREADNYSEASVFVFNQLVGTGIELTGGPIPEDEQA